MRKIIALALSVALVCGIAPSASATPAAMSATKASASVAEAKASVAAAAATADPTFAIQPKYDSVTNFYNGVAFVQSGDKWGLVDKTGKELVKPTYDGKDSYFRYGMYDGMSRVAKNEKWGYISLAGKEVVKPEYDFVYPFSEGLGAVGKNEKWGYVDKSGKTVIEPRFEEVSSFHNGVAMVYDSATNPPGVSLIDKTGRIIASTGKNRYLDLMEWQDDGGLIWLYSSYDEDTYRVHGFGAIDTTGKTVIPFIYDEPTYEIDSDEKGAREYEFTEGLTVVGQNHHRVVIDNKGKVVAKLSQYDGRDDFYYSEFSEGLAAISLGTYDGDIPKKWGYIDASGKESIAVRFDFAGPFRDGLAAVRIGEKWGFIDRTGKTVVEPLYEDVLGFYADTADVGIRDGLAWVRKNGLWGAIDPSGKEVIAPQYDRVGTPDGVFRTG